MISLELALAVVALIGALVEIFRQRGQQKIDNQKHLVAMQVQSKSHEQAMERASQAQIQQGLEMMNRQAGEWSAEMKRQLRLNEQLILDNSRNLELRAEAEMQAHMLEGQLKTLTDRLDLARADLMDAMQKVGKYEALQERQAVLEKAQIHVEKLLSVATEQNQKLTEENTRLKNENEQLTGQMTTLRKETARIPALEQEIQRLLRRIESLENQKQQLEKGQEDDTFNPFPFIVDGLDDAVQYADAADVSIISQPGDGDQRRMDDPGTGTHDLRSRSVLTIAGYRLI